MYKVILKRMPDSSWVLEGKNCIKLYAMQDIVIHPTEIKLITFGEMSYQMINSIGLPYIKKSDNMLGITLYHTKGTFRWMNSHQAQLPIINTTINDIFIRKNTYLASVRLMSIPFFNLWKRHNRSDDGLASCPIQVELSNE